MEDFVELSGLPLPDLMKAMGKLSNRGLGVLIECIPAYILSMLLSRGVWGIFSKLSENENPCCIDLIQRSVGPCHAEFTGITRIQR